MALFSPLYQTMGAGVLTDFGIWLNPGSRVIYVHHSGGRAGDIDEIRTRTYTTLNSALFHCRSGMGDTVVVLENHAENITTADQMSNLVAGTKIVGLGIGSNRPSFTWTAAGATFLLDVANVSIENCRLFMAGPHAAGTALTVSAAMTVSAAGCAMLNCSIKCGFDADQLCTIPITVTTGGDQFTFQGNDVQGLVAGPCTTFMRLTACEDTIIDGNSIVCATTAAAVGVVQALTTAPLRTIIKDNFMNNLKSDSTAALTPMTAQTGVISDNYLEIQSTGLAHITTGSSMSRFNNYGKNTGADETGFLLGTASA